ncbi:RimJ/RimL family protein N-acetyltransferase [Pedobacter sp. AK017]|uniref:GNAT family N-acetyltransferase n=1 Tax=Pedobacter sp. AK017 TaxID=2723073 RepID=UPI00160B6537|nr:GNAT family protein [Pedobacter sp. AK017]MBB5440485.1 RimJ/RimL family protein N-acetyltransferase [Pedobacter sp. AK017]
MEHTVLIGNHVKLEPLAYTHAAGLAEAAAYNPSLFKWTFVPQGIAAMHKYIEVALAGKEAGTMLPYAIVGIADGKVKGSTRYWNIQHWAWPENAVFYGKETPDVCEIGHTWLTEAAIRTPVNTECKLLLLTNAFENWKALRVCFQTDVRNERSSAAIERIGGKFEGVLRAERLGVDHTIRDTARFSIISAEWPAVKNKLVSRLKS